MDLYSIQSSGGEVHGFYPIEDDPDVDTAIWEGQLTEDLRDILGINGVRFSPLEIEGLKQERLVIDLNPLQDTPENVDRVHRAVGTFVLRNQGKI